MGAAKRAVYWTPERAWLVALFFALEYASAAWDTTARNTLLIWKNAGITNTKGRDLKVAMKGGPTKFVLIMN